MVKEALILNGGLGTRLYPLGKFLPKCLIPIYDAPLVVHHINMLESVGVERIYLVINHKFEPVIRQVLETGYEGEVEIKLIVQETSTGCGNATFLGKGILQDSFYLILGDEYYETDTFFRTTCNNVKYEHYLGVTHYDSVFEITSGCHVVMEEDRVKHLIEKPRIQEVLSGDCWNGAALTNPMIFEELERLKSMGKVDPVRGVVLVEAFIEMLNRGVKIGAMVDPGCNINVTKISDYLKATEVERLKKNKLVVSG